MGKTASSSRAPEALPGSRRTLPISVVFLPGIPELRCEMLREGVCRWSRPRELREEWGQLVRHVGQVAENANERWLKPVASSSLFPSCPSGRSHGPPSSPASLVAS